MAKCKGCGQEIIWIMSPSGKVIPCDPEQVTYWQKTKAGWMCHPDTFDPEECGTCAGKEYCGEYEEYIQEAQYADE